jgi:hypothetical protein
MSGTTTQAQVTTTADNQGVTGCVQSGAGTSGSAFIATFGIATCFYDNVSTVTGDYVIPFTTSGGTLSDTGNTFPTSGEVMGKVLDTHAACGSPPCGPYSTLLLTPDTVGGGGGVAGVTYYVDNAGSDSNAGTSTTTAFQTVAKLNTLSLNPGDRVLFNQ